MAFPLVVRMPYGGGGRAPELHDDSPEAYYVHTPGVKVAIPSTPSDAKGLLAAAIRDPDPVVFFEPKLHYRTMRGEVPEGEHVVPLGKGRTVREGTDVTLVAYGAMVPLAEQAADALEGKASVELLDIRTLKPLDEEALLAAAGKTGRVVIIQEAPRPSGGNIDCKELVAGTTLYLPIPVDRALFSAGDGHAAQGDGEVSGTGIETPTRAQLTLDVRDDLSLEWPIARIDGAWLTFGFHEHLGQAARIAVDGMLALMERELGVTGDDALVLASVGVDLRVTQVANRALGVHAELRDDAFR